MVTLGILSITFSGIQIGPITAPDLFLIPAAVGVLLAAVLRGGLRLPSWLIGGPCAVLAGGLIPVVFLRGSSHNFRVLFQFVEVMVFVPAVIGLAGRSPRERGKIARLFAVSAVANAVLGLLQFLRIFDLASRVTGWQGFKYNGGRARGLTAHPNQLGLVCAMALPVALYLYARDRRWAVGIATLAVGVLISGSRTGVLAGIAAVALFLFLAGRLTWAHIVKAVSVVAFAAVVGSILGMNVAVERFTTGDNTVQQADEARAATLQQGISDVVRHPVTGVGFGGNSHDLYLEIAQGGGLLALGGFGWFVLSAIRIRRRLPADPLVSAAAASMATWLFAGFFAPGLYDRFLYLPTGLLIGAALGRMTGNQLDRPAPEVGVAGPLG
jgi:hypothetical protein